MTFTPITLGTGLTSYNYLARTRDAQQALFDENPLNVREVEEVTEKLENVLTSDDLMEDRTLLKVALGAFGLDEDLNNRAFIKRILDSDLEDSQSLANRLTDTRYLALAETFNFNGADGPKLPSSLNSDALSVQLEGLETADDLLSDRSLLRASLERFGLEDNIENTYYLREVLESDLSDPNSFANRMNDDNLVEFADAFGFFDKALAREQSVTRVDEIVEAFSGNFGDIGTTEDLLANQDLLEESLKIFGLSDIYTDEFLRDVLNSDLFEADSFANTQSDARFAAFAAAFNFTTPTRDGDDNVVLDDEGAIVFETGNLELFLETVEEVGLQPATSDDLISDRTLVDAAFELLGIPQTVAARDLAKRVLDSDPTDEQSFANLFPDDRYSALGDLFTFETEQTERTYPEGFVDQVVRNYLDRQFEIQVGDVDPDMRIALSLERELTQVVGASDSIDAQWYSVMASTPLRAVFESAFRLPSQFGSIDVDQQLGILKDRSEQFFGTADVSEYLETETLDTLRQNYLTTQAVETGTQTSGASIASIILAGF
ncbi:MAG: DUF1217 domain-containing protein [Roseobacter sp.]